MTSVVCLGSESATLAGSLPLWRWTLLMGDSRRGDSVWDRIARRWNLWLAGRGRGAHRGPVPPAPSSPSSRLRTEVYRGSDWVPSVGDNEELLIDTAAVLEPGDFVLVRQGDSVILGDLDFREGQWVLVGHSGEARRLDEDSRVLGRIVGTRRR